MIGVESYIKYLIALQPKIRSILGPPVWGDRVYYLDTKTPSTYPVNENQGYIRIPLTIDDSSEEARRRSLWGMLSETVLPKETLYVGTEVFGNGYECGYTTKDGFYEKAIGDTPTEAILKALLAQEGLEVKG